MTTTISNIFYPLTGIYNEYSTLQCIIDKLPSKNLYNEVQMVSNCAAQSFKCNEWSIYKILTDTAYSLRNLNLPALNGRRLAFLENCIPEAPLEKCLHSIAIGTSPDNFLKKAFQCIDVEAACANKEKLIDTLNGVSHVLKEHLLIRIRLIFDNTLCPVETCLNWVGFDAPSFFTTSNGPRIYDPNWMKQVFSCVDLAPTCDNLLPLVTIGIILYTPRE